MADLEAGRPLLERQNSRTRFKDNWGAQLSHFAVPEEESHESIHGIAPAETRKGFIQKVYSILGIQLLWTATVVSIFMYYVPLRNGSIAFVTNHPYVFNILMIASLMSSICALMCKKNDYPSNMWIMGVFVTVVSCIVGVVCAQYAATGNSNLVAQAVLITAVIFLTLSAYAHLSKTDFSFMFGFLYVCLMANILLGFVAWLTGATFLSFLYNMMGVIIFSGFILVDTSMLIRKYGVDDYMIASIELYLDIINLFLHILALLGKR